MSGLAATDCLIESDVFQAGPQASRLFLESFREVAERHYRGSDVFRSFWKEAGMEPGQVRTERDLERVPFLMVHLFKEWDFCSVPRSEIVLTLTSSGTGGQKSQMLLNQGSLDRVRRLAFRVHEALGMTSPSPTNYLCFTYDPSVARDLGTAFTDELLTRFTQRSSVFYAFQWSPEKRDFFLDSEGALRALNRYADEGLPVRILGFPAFLYRFLRESGRSYELGPKSWVQTGGGWKSFSDKEIPKDEFRRFVSQRLGIPVENVRDLLGMVEHGIPYVDCALGNLHVPNYARVLVRSPRTLEVLPEGEKGLLQFLCTYNDSYPAMSILATDWGSVSRCRCGLPGPTLHLHGRAGIRKHKGCALTALEALK